MVVVLVGPVIFNVCCGLEYLGTFGESLKSSSSKQQEKKRKIVVTHGVIADLLNSKFRHIPKTINITGRLIFGSVLTWHS